MSIIYNTDIYENYEMNKKKNKTDNRLTKYEKTKILGLRAQQIATGCPVFTEIPDGMTNVIDIAKKELNERKIPFIVKRKIKENEYDYWKLDEMIY
mgnify:CR=1 FL=1|tara:strand:- start:1756 stop:2043 length:288 start_codon:yes stop_codon:yes gene_type:complete